MNGANIVEAFSEFISGCEHISGLAKLSDVLLKADTPFKRCITEREIDDAVDALKDFKHSKISKSTGYSNDRTREMAKDSISIMAELTKTMTKDFLRNRGLLVNNGIHKHFAKPLKYIQ